MTTRELIEELRKIDISGDLPVKLYLNELQEITIAHYGGLGMILRKSKENGETVCLISAYEEQTF